MSDAPYREGPYRDLGAGFARLTGSEAPRRAPSTISRTEHVLLELLKNARDAKARNVYVASTLRARRYRSLTVLDDGHGVPETHAALIFDPGVTSRHLVPVGEPARNTSHGAGLALHHIKNLALEADLLNCSSPTAFKVLLDTRTLPERSLQSDAESSPSNLLATAASFAAENPLTLYYASPASILARLLFNRIIQKVRRNGSNEVDSVRSWALGVGIEVSGRTVRRVLAGEVPAARPLGASEAVARGRVAFGGRRKAEGGALAVLGEGEKEEITAILRRAVGASYLELGEVRFESRPGEILLRARVHEPEDEYD